jgi:hypothetical protein
MGIPPADASKWLSENRDTLSRRIPLFQRLQDADARPEALKEIVDSPVLLSEAWSEVVQVMEETGAPASVISDAEEMARDLRRSLEERRISSEDRRDLVRMVDDLHTASSPREIEDRVAQAVRDGRLSPGLGDEMRQYTQNLETRRSDVTVEGDESTEFSWAACGFCGALAATSGGGAAIACVVCGVLAD